MNGLIKWFVRNPVAANLLMLAILIGGFLTLPTFNREIMPSMPAKFIQIQVVWPGGDPKEVEERIIVPIEEAINDIEGVSAIDATAERGRAMVQVEMTTNIDKLKLLGEIKAAVDAINTFPKSIERPTVELIRFQSRSLQVAVMADTDEKSLKTLATGIRDEIAKLPGVDFAPMKGVRNYEISVEISEEALREYGLSFDDVANAIRRASLNLPAGVIKASGGDISLRTRAQAYKAPDFEHIVVLRKDDGTEVLLKDVAKIRDGFVEDPLISRFNGKPAVLIDVKITTNPDVVAVSREVKAYLAEKQKTLPEGVELVGWLDLAPSYKSREHVLLSSGAGGLALVFLLLMLFLRPRIAFWVCVGMVTAFMGALGFLPMVHVSLNMISLFAFILVLGMVVDDAIVIAENIHSAREQGLEGEAAAIVGTIGVARPVLYAGLTTMVAFSPILFLTGVAASVMKPLPYVVIATLAFSLIEAYFILPTHLAHMKKVRNSPNPLSLLRRKVSSGLKRFVDKIYIPTLAWTLRHKGLNLSLFIGGFIITLSLLASGWVRQDFFPKIPGDYVIMDVTLTDGIAFERTEQVLHQVEEAAQRLNPYYKKHNGEEPVLNIQIMGQGNKIQVILDTIPTEQRKTPIEEIARHWRAEIGKVADMKDLEIGYQTWQRDKPLSFVLASKNPETLRKAAAELEEHLEEFAGVMDVTDTMRSARQELVLDLKPGAEAQGVSTQDLARQVRQAFFGEEAQRVVRGRDDVRVYVRYPKADRRTIKTLKDMRIRTEGGRSVPFEQVADYHFAKGVTRVLRLNRKPIVKVTGDIDRRITSPGAVVKEVTQTIVPKMRAKYPDLDFVLKGDQKEISKFKAGLKRNMLMTLIVMYILIAIAFRSYLQPLLIMSVIPFGFVGAIIGHLIFQVPWSMFSMFGIVATAGVVVNDNLVLIDYINELKAKGMELNEAVLKGAAGRFRPILLTTLTTFFGLLPITFQKAPQAQFLIPMAIALGFGVMAASFVTLMLVPQLYVTMMKVRHWFLSWYFPASLEREAARNAARKAEEEQMLAELLKAHSPDAAPSQAQ